MQEEVQHYDLLNIMMICLGESKEVDSEILKLLDVLLKDASPVEEKKRKLEEDFHIPMTHNIESGVESVSHVCDGFMEQGKEIGKEIEKIELIRKKIQKSKSLEIIADELECEQEEIRILYEIILKCGVEATIEEILEEVRKLESD